MAYLIFFGPALVALFLAIGRPRIAAAVAVVCDIACNGFFIVLLISVIV